MMTIEEFRATRRDVADARDLIVSDGLDGPQPACVYVGDLIIEKRAPWWPVQDKAYQLVIWNGDWVSDNLGELEEQLYRYACEEGLCGEAACPTCGGKGCQVCKVEQPLYDEIERLRAANKELLEALIWLVDDMTDAGEGDNPVTGEAYDSVASARAAIAKAKAEGVA